MAEYKDKLTEAGWHVLLDNSVFAETDGRGFVSVVVPEEARVSALVAHLVNACSATRVAYTNRVPLHLGGGKAVLVVDVTMEHLVTAGGSWVSVENGVTSVAACAEMGAERFLVYAGVFGGSQRVELCVLGDLERHDFEPGEPASVWIADTFDLAEGQIEVRPLRDEFREGAFAIRMPETGQRVRSVRDELAELSAAKGWWRPPGGDGPGEWRAEIPPDLLFARGPVALKRLARSVAPEFLAAGEVAHGGGGALQGIEAQLQALVVDQERLRQERPTRQHEMEHEMLRVRETLAATAAQTEAVKTLTEGVNAALTQQREELSATRELAKAAAESARESNQQTALIAQTMSGLMEQQRQLLALASPGGAGAGARALCGGAPAEEGASGAAADAAGEADGESEALTEVEMRRPHVRPRGGADEATPTVGSSSGSEMSGKKAKPAAHRCAAGGRAGVA